MNRFPFDDVDPTAHTAHNAAWRTWQHLTDVSNGLGSDLELADLEARWEPTGAWLVAWTDLTHDLTDESDAALAAVWEQEVRQALDLPTVATTLFLCQGGRVACCVVGAGDHRFEARFLETDR